MLRVSVLTLPESLLVFVDLVAELYLMLAEVRVEMRALPD
jgi:hypothetical protein